MEKNIFDVGVVVLFVIVRLVLKVPCYLQQSRAMCVRVCADEIACYLELLNFWL